MNCKLFANMNSESRYHLGSEIKTKIRYTDIAENLREMRETKTVRTKNKTKIKAQIRIQQLYLKIAIWLKHRRKRFKTRAISKGARLP